MKAYIKHVDFYLPEKILTNSDIVEQFPEWTVDKIEKKIGIKERHITVDGETASDLAIKAAEKLFAANNFDRSTIDYLIFVRLGRSCVVSIGFKAVIDSSYIFQSIYHLAECVYVV